MAVMANPTNEALVRRFYQEVWNEGNVEIAEEIFAADYVRHDLRPTRAAPGGLGMAAIAAAFRGAFPDLRMEIDLILSDRSRRGTLDQQGNVQRAVGRHVADRRARDVQRREHLPDPRWPRRRALEPPR
jgi:hypothetical protein